VRRASVWDGDNGAGLENPSAGTRYALYSSLSRQGRHVESVPIERHPWLKASRTLSIRGTQRVGSGPIQYVSLSPKGSQASNVTPSSTNSQKESSRNQERNFGSLTIRAPGMVEAVRQTRGQLQKKLSSRI
jgi:hypothetical protein